MSPNKSQRTHEFLKAHAEEVQLLRSGPELARKLRTAANHMQTIEGHKKRLMRQLRKIDPDNAVLKELEAKEK